MPIPLVVTGGRKGSECCGRKVPAVNLGVAAVMAGLIDSARYFALSRLSRCPNCGGRAGDNWFDRSLCICGVMHTRCSACGVALDDCDYEEAA